VIHKQTEYAATLGEVTAQLRGLYLEVDRSRSHIYLMLIALSAVGIVALGSGYVASPSGWEDAVDSVLALLGVSVIAGLGRLWLDDLRQRKELQHYGSLLLYLTEQSRIDHEELKNLPLDAAPSTVIMALRHYAGIDLSFLGQSVLVDDEDWRDIYGKTMKLWRDAESEKESAIQASITSHTGWELPIKSEALMNTNRRRIYGILSVCLGIVSMVSFGAATVIFVIASMNVDTSWWLPVKYIWDSLGVSASLIHY